jgi:hypothetical protein
MATVTKDFKVKAGLIVEGTQGTINNQTILTEVDGDAYILGLVGGESFITSVSNQFDVSAGKELSIDRTVVDAYYDAAGSADTAEDNAIAHTDARETAITTAYEAYADQAEVDAKAYTDTRETAITTAYEAYADTAEADAISAAEAYTDGRETAITTAYEAYADQAEVDAKAYTDTRETAITTAYEAYADTAEADAKAYADAEIAALVNGAPELLDTLNELAAALQDNPDVIADLQGIAAGKQDELTAGANIDITGATISVTGLDSADISDFDTAAVTANTGLWDTVGAAAAAEIAAVTTANSYTDGEITTALTTAQGYADAAETAAIAHADALTTDDVAEGSNNEYFSDERAQDAVALAIAAGNHQNIEITYANGALSFEAENGVADSDTDDLEEGSTNLYFTDARAVTALEAVTPNFVEIDINSIATQIAATTEVATASTVTAYAFPKASYRSAEYLVKVAYGNHTEISKVLLTLDTSDNIAITEYAIVGTNGSASTISADVSGTDVRLRVTTVNNDSDVTVVGTLVA